MKKKILLFILIFIIAISVAFGILAWQNRSTIEAFFMSKNMSQEEIEEEIKNSDKKVDDILKDLLHTLPRELTEEEKARIENGEASLYEIVGEIYKEAEAKEAETMVQEETEAKEENASEQEKQKKTDAAKQAEIDNVISQYIGKMYALEGQVSAQASGLISAAKAEYIAAAKNVPKEQRPALKASIISKYAGQAYAVAGNTDAQVSAIVNELKAYLKKNGRSTAIADEMYNTYLSKKSAMMAKYLK